MFLCVSFVGSVSSQEVEEDTTPVVDFSEAFGDFSFPEIPDTVDLFQQPDIETGLGDFIELFDNLQNPTTNPLQDATSGDRGIYLRTVPTIPAPGEGFYIQVTSGFLNILDIDQIRWFVDNQRVIPTENINKLNLIAKNVGEPTRVRIEIFDDEVGFITLERIILPMLVDILSEGVGVVPNWYLGKNIPAYHSPAKLTAIVDYIDISGRRYRNEDFIFEWKEGFYALDAPRRGANTFVTLPILNPNKPKRIDLRVSPINNSATAKVAVFVNPVIPNVYIYENDPVYGIINERVVGSNVFINENQSITVTAIPYFFNKGEGQGHMFDWFLDDNETGIKSNSIVLDSPKDTKDIKKTNLLLKTRGSSFADVLQYDEYEISVNF